MKKYFICLTFFLIGILGGSMFFHFTSMPKTNISEVRGGGYVYINPLLECEINGGLENKNLSSFKNKVQQVIDKAIAENSANDVSVYYRDLNNGPWFGINEDAPFAPQSLLKVPVLIAYLKVAESSPEILTEKLQFIPEIDEELDANLDDRMEQGAFYSIDTLLHRMIALSDNDAFYLLLAHIGSEDISKVHVDLGIAVPTQSTPDNFISVKSYASLFRVLYNASYLNRQMSEYALNILSETKYTHGLVAPLPTDIVVTHKYGIKNPDDGSKNNQLHDCGIIYKSESPYLLCVMTKGDSAEELEKVIQEISLAVFDNK